MQMQTQTQTSYENDLRSKISLSAKENISYEKNFGFATRYTDGPALPNKGLSYNFQFHKHDSGDTKQLIAKEDNVLFPYLEPNHVVFVKEGAGHKSNQAPISSSLSGKSILPISNRHLDFDIDSLSKRYSSNGCSSVGVSEKSKWSFQYDSDILETHQYNLKTTSLVENTLYPSGYYEQHHEQSGTTHPFVHGVFTEHGSSINNHTATIPKLSSKASEAQICSQEHTNRAYVPANLDMDMHKTSEKVIGPMKPTYGFIPYNPFGYRQHFADSNAYLDQNAETKTKNGNNNDFGPNMSSEDDEDDEDFEDDEIDNDFADNRVNVDSSSTLKSVQVHQNGKTSIQSNTSSSHETLQSSPVLEISRNSSARSHDKDRSYSSPSTPSSRRFSLIWRHVVFKGMKQAKDKCGNQKISSYHPKKKLPPQRSDLDKYWKFSEEDNSFTCIFEDCTQSFSRRYNVRSHIKTHLDFRQFKCKICLKSYVRNHDLNRHAKSHLAPQNSKNGFQFSTSSFKVSL